MLKKIEKPDISAIDSERFSKLVSDEKVQKLIQKSFVPYSHWEKIKRWNAPNGVSILEVWAAIKFIRQNILNQRESAVKDKEGKSFTWISYLPGLEEFLHQVDMKLGGNLFVGGNQVGDEMKHRLLSRGVMEEAIASSQLEGAHTSRKAAKQIILERRKPKNKDEQMIVNNYQAMLLIEDELKEKKLDENILFDLHQVLTINTLKDTDIGRYRKNEDDIIIGDAGFKDEIYHIPPKEDVIKKEIKRFIAYANDDLTDEGFVHPVIKAIILHFWFGYLHPFVDGNGRMARALFYWFLLRKKYWAFGFLPLSKVLKNAPAQYRDAYIYTEQDDNDLTYFIDFNIRKISQAMREFEEYAQKKWTENTRMAKVARSRYELNDRQIQLLRYYYKNKDATTSISTHMKIYGTSRITAMKDLRDLQRQGFVTSNKVGTSKYYFATHKVSSLFDHD
jgi:Fic family protein